MMCRVQVSPQAEPEEYTVHLAFLLPRRAVSMLSRMVTRHRRVATATLGAMLIAAAERTPAAQTSQPAAAAPPAPQSSGRSTTRRVGFSSDPAIITDTIDYFNQRFGEGSAKPKNGFYPESSNMLTGSGWVSAGPGYRHYFSDDQILLDTSAAVSWHLYKM